MEDINRIIKLDIHYNELKDIILKLKSNDIKVVQKFIPPNVYGYTFEYLDKLILSLMEEYIEFKEFHFKIKNYKLYNNKDIINGDYYELIDIFNYVLSITNVYYIKLKDNKVNRDFNNLQYISNKSNEIFKSLLYDIKIDDYSIKSNDVKDKENTLRKLYDKITYDLIKYIELLIYFRRKYPERKYHKPHSPLKLEDELNHITYHILKYSANISISLIKIIIKFYFTFIYDGSYDPNIILYNIYENIINKENYIFNL